MRSSVSNTQVIKLIRRLDKEQDNKCAYGLRKFRKLRSAQAILNTAPEVQAAIVTYAVETVGRLGAATARGAMHWQSDDRVPWVAFFLMDDLLRKGLPLTRKDFAAICIQLAGVGLLDSRFIKPLVAHLERMAAVETLQPALQRAAERLRCAITGEKLSPAAARLWKRTEWGPDAPERKLAGRIERMLAGPLELSRA